MFGLEDKDNTQNNEYDIGYAPYIFEDKKRLFFAKTGISNHR
jgi:hypothetical protein